jgi:DNA replication protein DnaC
MAKANTIQALDASKKSSAPEPPNADVELMKLTLHHAGIPTADLTHDQVRQAYAKQRANADATAAERDRRWREEFQQRVQRDQEDWARRALERHGVDPTGMTTQEIQKRLDAFRREAEQQRREDQQRQLAEQRRRRGEILFAAAGCPELHVRNLDKIDDNARWRAEHDLLVERLKYADPFLFALVGISGPGKTQIAVNVIHRACADLMTARYIKVLNLFQKFRRAYTPRAKGEAGEREDDILAEFVAFDVLVIDEVHQRAESEYEQNALTNLLDLRYDACKGTILIANQTKEQFGSSMGPSVISRIHQCGEVRECNWPSYRKPGSWREHSQEPRRPSGVQQPRSRVYDS